MQDVSADYLFAIIGKHHVESGLLQGRVAQLENELQASQAQVKLLMEQLSNKQQEKPNEG